MLSRGKNAKNISKSSITDKYLLFVALTKMNVNRNSEATWRFKLTMKLQ